MAIYKSLDIESMYSDTFHAAIFVLD
jgi:hypothetical protein